MLELLADLRTDGRKISSIDVDVFDGPALASAGIELHTLDMRRRITDLRGVMRLTRVLRRVRPDVLQTWLYHADLLGSLVQRLASP